MELIRFAAIGTLYAWLLVLSLRVASERLPRAWRNGGGPGYVKDVLLGALALVMLIGTATFILSGY